MIGRHKNFAFYVCIGLITFTVLNYLVSPESASARTINIRDYYGRVTTEGWWVANIFSPLFIIFEFLKIALGILLLPLTIFGFHGGQELISAGWSNLTVMWPGLLFYFFVLCCFAILVPEEDKSKEDKPEEDKPEEDK